jgi:L,D-transpeptidase YcbB
MTIFARLTKSKSLRLSALGLALAVLALPAGAQVTAFKQAVAEAASSNDAIATFYRQSGYDALWTGQDADDQARRAALIQALRSAEVHGLPNMQGQADALIAQLRDVRSTRDLGLAEVALSRAFVDYAKDIQTGQVVPASIDNGIVRKVPASDPTAYLVGLSQTRAHTYFRDLPPGTRQYRDLMKQRLKLKALIARGGWGPQVPVKKMEPGDSGEAIIALRNRLIAMGYMDRSLSRSYDASLQAAVQRFQSAHGLEPDGVAGKGTLSEINKPASARLKSVIVAMERERWTNFDRGDRHVLVNQTDFTARIVDHGHVTFETRSVIGKNVHDRRSPEFSDEMEHMIINPSWHVPRSIVTKEYLPQLQSNPNAAGHIEITDSRGRRVDRGAVDFTQFTAKTFPFAMRQPPSRRNALGLVKFMFPNKHNIYLHDTPAKNLFSREVRAYSHGCIRLADPFDFAYTLLAVQNDSPKDYFHRVLNTGKETKVDLVKKVPVHIIYRTAFTSTRGDVEYRRDVYGRDAKIWAALEKAGVSLGDVQS